MDKTFLIELLKSLKYEAIRFRSWCVALFVAASFAPLVVGYFWPNSYSAEATLHADESNIIEPLLEGRASVTDVDRANQAREALYTRRVMEKAAEEAGLIEHGVSDDERARVLQHLRNNIKVKTEGKNVFKVSYASTDPDTTFRVLNNIVNVFIEDTARKKREESASAYNFIDSQVQSYKRQLEQAEEKLKDFRAQNTDGTEAQVSARINQLRNDIESLKLDIEDSESRLGSIKNQLEEESRYQSAKGEAERLREKRQEMARELEQLRLQYQNSYPDVVSLRQQIKNLDEEIAELEFDGGYSSGEKVENPLYEELRKQQSVAEVELQAQRRRLNSLQRLLEEEHLRAERVAANQAQFSELTRDLEVTKDVYEEMLQRKESARLSMTLDVQGQGVRYKIQEPASFPLNPTGLRYVYFAAAGPFVGVLAPLGLLFAYILLDPRIRSASSVQRQLPEEVELVGVIPHYHTPLAERLLRKDMLVLLGLSLVAMACYVVLGIYWYDVKN